MLLHLQTQLSFKIHVQSNLCKFSHLTFLTAGSEQPQALDQKELSNLPSNKQPLYISYNHCNSGIRAFASSNFGVHETHQLSKWEILTYSAWFYLEFVLDDSTQPT